jgi:hypothetical protein
MKELFIAIDKIRTLDYLVDADAAMFCSEFNESYNKIAERYRKCRAALDSGNISGAVKISEQQPPLTELLKLLATIDFFRYSEFCERNSFVCPDFITVDELEALVADYCRIDTLGALKAFYKKILLDKDIFMQMTLLRRLIMLDLNNRRDWINNIKPVEKQYLKGVLTRIKHLTSYHEFHELAAARHDLRANEWHSTLPDNFHNAIEKKYLTLKNSFYQHRATEAIEALQADFDPDYPLNCAGRIGAIEAFLEETDYQPSAEYNALKARIDTAVDTYEKQQQFDLVADELRLQLEHPDCDRVLIEATLDKLKRFELPIPDRLDVRTVNKITGIELFKQRKSRFKRLLLFLVILVILSLVGVSLFFFQRSKHCNSICAEINKLVRNGKYPQAMSFYEKSLKVAPFMANYTQLIKARSNLEEAIRHKYELDKKFILVKKQLNKIRAGDFTDSGEQMKLMLDNAAKYADDDLEKMFIKQLKVDYETLLNKRRQAAINAFNVIVSEVSGRLSNYKSWEKLAPKQRASELKSVLDRLLTGEKYVADLNADNKLRYAEYKTEIKERLTKARQQQQIVDDAAKSFEDLLATPPASLGLLVNAIKIINDNVPHDRRYRELLHYSELMEEMQSVYGQGDGATLENVAEKWQSWRNDYATWQKLLNTGGGKPLLDFISSYPIKSLTGIKVRKKLSEEKEQWYYLSTPEYNQHWGKYNITIYHSDKSGKVVPAKRSYRKTEYYVTIEKNVHYTKYADSTWLNEIERDMPPSLLFYNKYLRPVCEDSKVPAPVKLLYIKAFINSLPMKQAMFAEELKPFKQLLATDISSDWLASPFDIGNERYKQIKLKYRKLYRNTMLSELAVIVDKYRQIVAMYRWSVSPYFILSGVMDYSEPNLQRKEVKYLFAIGYRKQQNGNSYYPKIVFIRQPDSYRKLVTDAELFNGMPLLGLRLERDFEKYVKFSKKYNIVPDLFKSIQGR